MKEILEVILAGLVENIDSITILEKETGNLTEIEVKIPAGVDTGNQLRQKTKDHFIILEIK